MKLNTEKQVQRKPTFKIRYQCMKVTSNSSGILFRNLCPKSPLTHASNCYPLKQSKKFWRYLELPSKAFPLNKSDVLKSTAFFFLHFSPKPNYFLMLFPWIRKNTLQRLNIVIVTHFNIFKHVLQCQKAKNALKKNIGKSRGTTVIFQM